MGVSPRDYGESEDSTDIIPEIGIRELTLEEQERIIEDCNSEVLTPEKRDEIVNQYIAQFRLENTVDCVSRKRKEIPKKADPELAYDLHKQGLIDREIAKRLGVSRSTISSYLRELGVTRSQGPISKYSDMEKAAKRKGISRNRQEKIRQLRDDFFESSCQICGVSKEKRKIAIHNKKFEGHDLNALWRKPFLQKVRPEEWASLCIMCHRGVHWAHDNLGMEWPDVEAYSKKNKENQKPNVPLQESSQKSTRKYSPSRDDTTKDMRKALFGDECHFCGPIPEDKNHVIHRKDGTPHDRKQLWDRDFLKKMNTEEWQMVCQRHHRYVHWGMEHLGLRWEDIESVFKKNK